MSSARDYAFRLLGLRRMTEMEVRRKLALRKYPNEEIDAAIADSVYYGYIDDEDYAKCYVSDGFKLKKWGRKRIFLELKKRGISEELVEKAFSDCPNEESEILKEYVSYKYENLSSLDVKDRQKVLSALLRRGFSFGNIQEVMNTYDLIEDDYE